jgi:3-oxoacyl-[acyl-carrier protein] reductase
MLSIDLSNRRALVCGSTQGIGRGIAEQLALAGAKVTLMARNEKTLNSVVKDLPGSGHDTLVMDFSNPSDLEVNEAKIMKAGYDILVNNTGGPAPGPAHTAQWGDFAAAIDMHLKMSHQLTQYVLPEMKERKFGRIINVISTSVKIPIMGLGVSNTVRGAMASWAKTLANELGGWGITVNNLLPGFIDTQRLGQLIVSQSEKLNKSEQAIIEQMQSTIPIGRFGEPSEMGAMAAFLASPLAGYISGTSIPVDGGKTGTI